MVKYCSGYPIPSTMSSSSPSPTYPSGVELEADDANIGLITCPLVDYHLVPCRLSWQCRLLKHFGDNWLLSSYFELVQKIINKIFQY